MGDAEGRPTIFLVESLGGGDIALGAMGIHYIAKLQQQITFGKRGHAAIVDRRGNIIARPNPEWSATMKNISAVKPVAHMIVGKSGVSEFYSPAVKMDMITGFTTVPGVGLGVMVPQPLEELQEKAASARGAQIGIIVGGILLASLLGWLLSNAVKFTPQGGQVKIHAEVEADEIVIAISDDGIGMTAAEMEQAMQPFTQVDSSLERRFEGTGLGLPLAKLLVEGHGDSLNMESAPGKGTTLFVRLPAVSEAA